MATNDWDAGLLDQIYGFTTQGVMATDEILTIRLWNHWMEMYSGHAAADVIGRNLLEVYPDLVERQMDYYYQKALGGQVSMLAERFHGYLIPMPVSPDLPELDSMRQSARIGPLFKEGRCIGTVTVIDDVTERIVTERVLNSLLAREQATRVAIEDAAARILRLQMVTAALSESLTWTQVAAVIIEQASVALEAVAGLVAGVDDQGKRFKIIHSSGYQDEFITDWRSFPITDAGPLAEALSSSMPVLVDISQHASNPVVAALLRFHGDHQTLAVIPLLVEGRAIGVLSLCFVKPRILNADDWAFAGSIALQGALALERARLYEAERHARADAERAVRIRDSFFSIASHELKTPLTVLLGQTELLQRRLQRLETVPVREQQTVRVVIEQGRRMNAMINKLLDVSRMQTGILSLDYALFDLSRLVQRVVHEVQTTTTHHTLELDISGTPLLINGDEMRLEQVIQNLISNAIKYNPTGGIVRVVVAADAAFARMQVVDQGIGIPLHAQSQLFQRFYRADNALAQNIHGMGIGLYVVKQVVELHDGIVIVDSSEDHGSTFTIRLPRIVDEY